MTDLKELQEPTHTNTWCPGCGNFGILMAIQKSFVDLNLNPKDTVLVSGIGCNSKLPHYIKTYGFESLHGRAMPVATGIKLANPDLNVVVVAGDGDAYSIGSAHFLHAFRRNLDLCYIVHDNEIYALTKAQYSPTTIKGYKSSTSPHGSIEIPFNPLAVAISAGATFVARGYAGNIAHLTELIKKGIQHKGVAIIDVLQPCVSWRKDISFDFYKDKVYDVNKEGFKTDDKSGAIKFLLEHDVYSDKIATGIFYEENRPTYEEELKINDKTPVCKQNISNIDISPLLKKLE